MRNEEEKQEVGNNGDPSKQLLLPLKGSHDSVLARLQGQAQHDCKT